MEEFFDSDAPGRGFLFLGVFARRLTGFIRYIDRGVEPWSSKTRSVPAVKAVERRNETVFALESTVFRSAKYYSVIMDMFDFRPRFSPVINSIPYRFSIGAYRGRKRVVIAWFSDEEPANDYLIRCRLDYPAIRFDCLKSLL